MTSPILVTKLFIPSLRLELVKRQRLIDQLHRGVRTKLTLVSAPPGFGKTTLISTWINSLEINKNVGWISLDESDNDPTRFLAYLIAAINRAVGEDVNFGQSALGLLQSTQFPPINEILATLINEIAVFTKDMVLILDDYHLIEKQSIHDGLLFLLDNMPPQLHIAIITREDPPLPIARLRARGQLTELRAADLRFTPTETADFLNRVMKLGLSQENITALETRTEGWIAGLQLAAISLQGQTDTSKLIQSFTGSNRLVLDYLIEEVLNQQPENIQKFLFHTSILNRFCGPLCDAVRFEDGTNNHDSGQSVLEILEHTNLFLNPLDNERQWFRYHHLFADLLRQKLHQTDPELIPELHRRASVWFEHNGFIDESIEHAFSAEDPERAADLIDSQADRIWGRGEHYRLWPWLLTLSEEYLYQKPRLCLLHAWYLFSTGKREESQQCLKVAEGELNRLKSLPENMTAPGQATMSATDIRMLQGRLASIQAMMDSWWEDVPNMILHAKEALEILPSGDPWYGSAMVALGDAYYYKGDIKAAYQTRLETVTTYEGTRDTFWYLIANLKVVTTLRHMAKLKETIELCEQLLESINQSGLVQAISLGWLYSLWGDSLSETVEIQNALPLLMKSVKLTRGKDYSFFAYSELCLIRHYFYKNDFTMAEKFLLELQDINVKQYLPTYNKSSLVYWQVRLFLAQNQTKIALKFYNQQKLTAISEGSSLIQVIALARIFLAQRRFSKANELLLQEITTAKELEYAAREIEMQILHALTYQALGRPKKAIEALTQALSLAEPGGYIWLFVNEGPPMAQLLFQALEQRIAPQYVQQLLAAYPSKEEKLEPINNQDPETEWIEPLSEREQEVLQFVARGLTNQEIASKLFLTLNTIKTHTRNIYGKLNVNSRIQAVDKARSLGVIPSN